MMEKDGTATAARALCSGGGGGGDLIRVATVFYTINHSLYIIPFI
jgi:hypothetical protein